MQNAQKITSFHALWSIIFFNLSYFICANAFRTHRKKVLKSPAQKYIYFISIEKTANIF